MRFYAIFRTPPHGIESWQSSDFLSVRQPTVVGGRGLGSDGDAGSLILRCSAKGRLSLSDCRCIAGVEWRSQPGACTGIANNNNSGVVSHGCRVSESAYVEPSDVARPATGLVVTVAGRAAPVLRQACRRGDGGGVVEAEGRGRPGVDSVRDGVLLVVSHSEVTSSCDHAATSPAVLVRSSSSTSGGASASVQRQCVLPRCEQRQEPTAVPVLGQGGLQARVVQRQVSLLVCAVHMQRQVPLQGLPTESFGRILHISYVCALFPLGNLDIISTSSLYLAATAPVFCDSQRKLLDVFLVFLCEK